MIKNVPIWYGFGKPWRFATIYDLNGYVTWYFRREDTIAIWSPLIDFQVDLFFAFCLLRIHYMILSALLQFLSGQSGILRVIIFVNISCSVPLKRAYYFLYIFRQFFFQWLTVFLIYLGSRNIGVINIPFQSIKPFLLLSSSSWYFLLMIISWPRYMYQFTLLIYWQLLMSVFVLSFVVNLILLIFISRPIFFPDLVSFWANKQILGC